MKRLGMYVILTTLLWSVAHILTMETVKKDNDLHPLMIKDFFRSVNATFNTTMFEHFYSCLCQSTTYVCRISVNRNDFVDRIVNESHRGFQSFAFKYDCKPAEKGFTCTHLYPSNETCQPTQKCWTFSLNNLQESCSLDGSVGIVFNDWSVSGKVKYDSKKLQIDDCVPGCKKRKNENNTAETDNTTSHTPYLITAVITIMMISAVSIIVISILFFLWKRRQRRKKRIKSSVVSDVRNYTGNCLALTGLSGSVLNRRLGETGNTESDTSDRLNIEQTTDFSVQSDSKRSTCILSSKEVSPAGSISKNCGVNSFNGIREEIFDNKLYGTNQGNPDLCEELGRGVTEANSDALVDNSISVMSQCHSNSSCVTDFGYCSVNDGCCKPYNQGLHVVGKNNQRKEDGLRDDSGNDSIDIRNKTRENATLHKQKSDPESSEENYTKLHEQHRYFTDPYNVLLDKDTDLT